MSKSNIYGASAAYALERPLLVEMLWSISSTSMKTSRASSVSDAMSATNEKPKLLAISDRSQPYRVQLRTRRHLPAARILFCYGNVGDSDIAEGWRFNIDEVFKSVQITHPINGQTMHFYVSKLAAKIGTERINTKFSQVAKKAFLQSSAGTFATAGLEGTGAKAT
ncbi:hypothetical protein H2202_002149 [Exophiala xenobiotica]|nr:hypothetical protein H2202_002149 [Exophiala xenobiotica]